MRDRTLGGNGILNRPSGLPWKPRLFTMSYPRYMGSENRENDILFKFWYNPRAWLIASLSWIDLSYACCLILRKSWLRSLKSDWISWFRLCNICSRYSKTDFAWSLASETLNCSSKDGLIYCCVIGLNLSLYDIRLFGPIKQTFVFCMQKIFFSHDIPFLGEHESKARRQVP